MDKYDETDSVFDISKTQPTERSWNFDKLLTKEEFHEGCNKIKRGQRKIIALATHILDEEKAATKVWMDRIEREMRKG